MTPRVALGYVKAVTAPSVLHWITVWFFTSTCSRLLGALLCLHTLWKAPFHPLCGLATTVFNNTVSPLGDLSPTLARVLKVLIQQYLLTSSSMSGSVLGAVNKMSPKQTQSCQCPWQIPLRPYCFIVAQIASNCWGYIVLVVGAAMPAAGHSRRARE